MPSKSSWNSNKKYYHCKKGINPKYKTNIGISSRKQLKEQLKAEEEKYTDVIIKLDKVTKELTETKLKLAEEEVKKLKIKIKSIDKRKKKKTYKKDEIKSDNFIPLSNTHSTDICWYHYNNINGCFNGKNCHYLHT